LPTHTVSSAVDDDSRSTHPLVQAVLMYPIESGASTMEGAAKYWSKSARIRDSRRTVIARFRPKVVLGGRTLSATTACSGGRETVADV
jgi:hypothetical protein